jgi:periplasmic divalent cation tolerance protein
MTKEFIQIQWTCGNLEEARRISRELIQKKWVACAQIIPWIESIFMWNDQLDIQQESKVIFKTVRNSYEDVKNFILDHALYEVPEILVTPIIDGHQDYLNWVSENVQHH